MTLCTTILPRGLTHAHLRRIKAMINLGHNEFRKGKRIPIQDRFICLAAERNYYGNYVPEWHDVYHAMTTILNQEGISTGGEGFRAYHYPPHCPGLSIGPTVSLEDRFGSDYYHYDDEFSHRNRIDFLDALLQLPEAV